MISLKTFSITNLKSQFQVKKPWDNIIISVLNILITIPTFIIAHQNIIDPNWYLEIDRILLFLGIITAIHLVLRGLRTIIIVFIALYVLVLFYGTVLGNYGFAEIAQDYRSMLFTMSEDPNPQDVIIARLLPFPNKSKIIQAADYQNPKVRNFALMATTKHFRELKNFKEYRTLIQCFAVFTEIKSRWNYVNDPKGHEYIASANESLIHFSGDCDDHAILMSACIRAIGGTPRIIATSNHLYPEILIGSKADFEAINFIIKQKIFAKETKGKQLHYHIDERGKIWLNLDYTAKYPGGPFMSEEILGALTLK